MSCSPLTIEELAGEGISTAQARELCPRLNEALRSEPATDAWMRVVRILAEAECTFSLHQRLFGLVYADWDERFGPPPAWMPPPETVDGANVTQLMQEIGVSSVRDLHAWSVQNRTAFWQSIVEKLGVKFSTPYGSILDTSSGFESPRWFVGGKLNIAASCFHAEEDQLAVISAQENGILKTASYGELKRLVQQVAGSLAASGLGPGDAVATYLPMTYEAVAIYLGVIWAGGVVVGLAESLSPPEVKRRLSIVEPKFVFTQDVTIRGGKKHPLYEKLCEIEAPPAIVLMSETTRTRRLPTIREVDRGWNDFLDANSVRIDPVPCDPQHMTGVLFSSGTTADPKAIPWDHTTPIKCAADAWLHHDIHPGDRLAWPTSLGWMMGPWLIFSSLINRASMALFEGSPASDEFAEFVKETEVTMLGVVPTLVSAWRSNHRLDGARWSRLRSFSSTGECSQADDMFWLSSRAGYRPVIEYCGGTEIGGGYLSSTVVEPFVPATFTTPAFGTDICLVDEAGQPCEQGEVLIECPSIGFSTTLLNSDHHAAYFQDVPRREDETVYRRHGDCLQRLPGGSFRAHGRIDDSMNLGGIKVSSAEIERVLNLIEGIRETAAIAVAPPEGGPHQLAVFVVLEAGNEANPVVWTTCLQTAISRQLNPLFRIERLAFVAALPRTASNKVMRRTLRESLPHFQATSGRTAEASSVGIRSSQDGSLCHGGPEVTEE